MRATYAYIIGYKVVKTSYAYKHSQFFRGSTIQASTCEAVVSENPQKTHFSEGTRISSFFPFFSLFRFSPAVSDSATSLSSILVLNKDNVD